MFVTRTSVQSGKVRTLEIPCSIEEYNRWQNGELIQNAMPNVPTDLREFLITGITPEEWNELFSEEDSEYQ